MDNTKNKRTPGLTWWRAHRPTIRRLAQLYSALLHNAYVKGFITGEIYRGNGKFLCAPGLNCYSCPGAAASCPLGALQNALGSANHRAGWYVLGIILLLGVTLGRTVCGWLCPMGLIQELMHRVPTLKIKKSAVTRVLSWLKYLLMAVFVIAVPLWYSLARGIPLPAFCKYICPAGTLEGAVALLSHPANRGFFSMLGLLFTRKFIILLVVGLACVFCYRAFCRFLCPLGAIYGLFNRFNIVGVRVDAERCNRCGACVRGCGMDVRRVGDRECIQCGRCMASCAQGAISIQAGRVTLKAPETGRAGDAPDASRNRRRLWAVALILLAVVLLWVNVLEPASREGILSAPAEQLAESATPVGHEVGERLDDFTLTCYDGTDYRLSEQRGRVVFINLWATYCTPCIQELPYFDALLRAHEGDISVLAVHSGLVTDDPESFLSGTDYAILFATDSDNAVTDLVGGTGTLPQTVALDRDGKVIYNQVGSVTPELLDALYNEADNK